MISTAAHNGRLWAANDMYEADSRFRPERLSRSRVVGREVGDMSPEQDLMLAGTTGHDGVAVTVNGKEVIYHDRMWTAWPGHDQVSIGDHGTAHWIAVACTRSRCTLIAASSRFAAATGGPRVRRNDQDNVLGARARRGQS